MMAQQFRWIALAVAAVTLSAAAHAQAFGCEDHFKLDAKTMAAYQYGPPAPPPSPEPRPNPLELRALKYAALAMKHKLSGLASYYSTSLDGSLTATGEIFRNHRFTAAHLTLPLGSWVEITARATGKKIRCRVNDRGPYVRKFVVDLSQAAARALGVDRTADRTVEIRIIALPGEQPLSEGWEAAGLPTIGDTAATAAAITQ
jgi:rare lipoprotein A